MKHIDVGKRGVVSDGTAPATRERLRAREKRLNACGVRQLDENEALDMEDFRAKLSDKTKLVAVVHVSNTLGCVNDVKTIVSSQPSSCCPRLLFSQLERSCFRLALGHASSGCDRHRTPWIGQHGCCLAGAVKAHFDNCSGTLVTAAILEPSS